MWNNVFSPGAVPPQSLDQYPFDPAPHPAASASLGAAAHTLLQREQERRQGPVAVYQRTPSGSRIYKELMKKTPRPGDSNHRFALMADRYRKYRPGDNLHEYDIKREAFNLLAPHEQYHLFTQLPNDKRTDLWQNKLSPEQRIGFATHDYHLVADLTAGEQDEWAAIAAQKLYRGSTARRQFAAQQQAPYADPQTFYWAIRSPELIRMRSHDPGQFNQLFGVYQSTAPLQYFGQPMLFHSMRRPEELDEVARRFGMREVGWMRYMPSGFGGHTWEKNLVWLQSGLHRGLPVLLTVPLDDETVVRGSLLRSADTSLHSTERGLAAYPREILAMRPHYHVVNRQDGLQALMPLGSGQRVPLEELKNVPATMPKEMLRQTLEEFGLDVRGLSRPGAAPAPLRHGVPTMTPTVARAVYFNALQRVDALEKDITRFEAMVEQQLDSAGNSAQGEGRVPDDIRARQVDQFRMLLMRLNSALADMDASLKLPLFSPADQRHANRHVRAIRKLQDMVDSLESINSAIFADDAAMAPQHAWTVEFLDAKLGLALGLEDRILARLAGESPPSSLEASSDEER